MNTVLERQLEARFGRLYGEPASALVVENQDPANNKNYPLSVLIRFPVSTPEKHLNPDGVWYEIRHDLGQDHAQGLLSGIPEKVDFEIGNLMAAAKAHWGELSNNIAHQKVPPYRVDGPHKK